MENSAQENVTLLFQPEISFGYNVNEKYSHSFGIENRNYLYNDSEFDYVSKHIEISHQSDYTLNERQTIGLAMQYRFQENFDPSSENEFQLAQKFEWQTKKRHLDFNQTLKSEQRFYASTTKYRSRYEIGLKFAREKYANYFLLESEILLEVAKTQKPEFEQRFSGIMGWNKNSKFKFEIGLQYRLTDFTQNLGHELFIISGIDFKL